MQGQIWIFWVSGPYAGDKERINQGRFTEQFRKLDPILKRNPNRLIDLNKKMQMLNAMGKDFKVKVRLEGGGENKEPGETK